MKKVLFVDETENDDYFIVAGLLVQSKLQINHIYKMFKHSIKNYGSRLKEKELIYHEYKSTFLDKRYKKIKFKMFEIINGVEYKIYYCVFKKKNPFKQKDKEEVYISLITKIVNAIDCDLDVIYDSFHKKDFENKIELSMSSIKNIISINKAESFNEPGLQYIDNICGSIRISLIDDENICFRLIKGNIIKID